MNRSDAPLDSLCAVELGRRRAATRRMAIALAASALALYLVGFWFER